MNIKVLPLEFWMDEEYHDGIHLQEITPKFYRDGQYLFNKLWWFESNGRAYTYDTPEGISQAVDMFNHQLSMSLEYMLTDRERVALEQVCKLTVNPSLKREAKAALFRHGLIVQLREVTRGAALYQLRFLKDYAENG